jgi:hypothetical protein
MTRNMHVHVRMHKCVHPYMHAMHAHSRCKHISGQLPEHVAAIVHADCVKTA